MAQRTSQGVKDGGSALPSGTAQPALPRAEALGRCNPDQRAPSPALAKEDVLYATRPKPPAQRIRATRSHYAVLDKHLEGRSFIVGNGYTIADISAWGWIDRASFVLPGSDDPLAPYPNIRRWFHSINERPAVAKARAVGSGHAFKKEVDEETRRALFPSNYPPAAA